MRSDRWERIGTLRRSHGKYGAIRCTVDKPYESQFLSHPFIYVDVKGDLVPFFFTERDGANGQYVVQFDDVLSPEKAKQIAGAPIYFLKTELTQETINNLAEQKAESLDQFIGWKIVKETDHSHYTIISVDEYPQQWMFTVEDHVSCFLIPYVPEWITSIDQESQVMIMQLPEGLILSSEEE